MPHIVSDRVRPNLLYLVHRLPYPPDKGDRIRAFHIIRQLATRANVSLACLADEPVPTESLKALDALGIRVGIVRLGRERWLRGALSLGLGGTATLGIFWSPAFHRMICEWTFETKFSAVLASSSALVPYLRQRELRAVPAVVDLVDVDSQKWFDYAAATAWAPRGWLYRTEGRRLRKVEAALPSWAKAITVVSDIEAAIFRGFRPTNDLHVVPNGVDLDYFRPHEPGLVEEGCVFVGALDYRPNIDAVVWFCQAVWPVLRATHPTARLRLVGRKPTPEVQRLAGIAGVEVVGDVPDVRPHLAWAAVAIAPLRIARGVQNKVLEALAMRKAVVASPQALQGLRERLDLPALTANQPAEWAEHLGRLLDDPPLRRQLGAAGRRYVEAHHAWDRCLAPFDELLGIKSVSCSATAYPVAPCRE